MVYQSVTRLSVILMNCRLTLLFMINRFVDNVIGRIFFIYIMALPIKKISSQNDLLLYARPVIEISLNVIKTL